MQTQTYSRITHRSRRRGPSTITIPSGVSPHVKLVFEEMRRQGITYEEVEDGSGVLKTTLKAWRHKNRPSFDALCAVLGFLGWDFVPIPRDRVLDPDVIAVLQPAAKQVGLDLGDAAQFAAEIAFGRPMASATQPSGRLQ
jgi:transcriptional regulator with XRE-family HTH domain